MTFGGRRGGLITYLAVFIVGFFCGASSSDLFDFGRLSCGVVGGTLAVLVVWGASFLSD